MALQLGAVLAAFRAADVPDEVAQRAAEELAGYGNRFHDDERRLKTGFSEIRLEFGRVDRHFVELESKFDQLKNSARSETNLLRWMITSNLGLTVLVLGRMFGVMHG